MRVDKIPDYRTRPSTRQDDWRRGKQWNRRIVQDQPISSERKHLEKPLGPSIASSTREVGNCTLTHSYAEWSLLMRVDKICLQIKLVYSEGRPETWRTMESEDRSRTASLLEEGEPTGEALRTIVVLVFWTKKFGTSCSVRDLIAFFCSERGVRNMFLKSCAEQPKKLPHSRLARTTGDVESNGVGGSFKSSQSLRRIRRSIWRSSRTIDRFFCS